MSRMVGAGLLSIAMASCGTTGSPSNGFWQQGSLGQNIFDLVESSPLHESAYNSAQGTKVYLTFNEKVDASSLSSNIRVERTSTNGTIDDVTSKFDPAVLTNGDYTVVLSLSSSVVLSNGEYKVLLNKNIYDQIGRQLFGGIYTTGSIRFWVGAANGGGINNNDPVNPPYIKKIERIKEGTGCFGHFRVTFNEGLASMPQFNVLFKGAFGNWNNPSTASYLQVGTVFFDKVDVWYVKPLYEDCTSGRSYRLVVNQAYDSAGNQLTNAGPSGTGIDLSISSGVNVDVQMTTGQTEVTSEAFGPITGF
ncbi:MAG: Ig-like domain-containing protein [Bdellovibrionota bacterium]